MLKLKHKLEDSVALINMNIELINGPDDDALSAMDDILCECNNILNYLGNNHEGLKIKLQCTPQKKET